jgi:hypothetical protein
MGDSTYDDTTDITIPSRGGNKLVVTNYRNLSKNERTVSDISLKPTNQSPYNRKKA